MSIINEALKKAQENKETQTTTKTVEDQVKAEEKPRRIIEKPKKKNKFVYLAILAIIFGGVIFAGKSIFLQRKTTPSAITKTKTDLNLNSRSIFKPAVNLSADSSRPALILSGIVYDEERPYAIVNNKVLLKGDVIEGATLVEINRDSVKFKFQDKEFELTAE